MPLKIAICDDNTDDIMQLANALKAYDTSIQISTYNNGETLLWDLLEQKSLFDLYFLDIYMPGLNGLETAKKIRAELKNTLIVFLSSSNEYYPEAFDVFAFNYLLKPINIEKLIEVLKKAQASVEQEQELYMQVSYKGSTSRILCKDILYIESKDKIIIFHMLKDTSLQCYAKLSDITKDLPENLFLRCHQSYTVNITHVTEMSGNNFSLGQVVINISKKYTRQVKEKYFAYLFNNMNRGR